ncbi:class I SAM-dependent methyltransferase [Spirillospora sp. CA-255316]
MGVPADYDEDPGRFRLATRVTERYLTGTGGLYEHVAARLSGDVLDIGCGEGALSAALGDAPPGDAASSSERAVRVVGVDASATMLRAHPRPAVRATAVRLPFKDGVFDAAVAVNMLYHLDDPVPAIREARRVLAPGGLFVASAISRYDSPELAHVWRREATCFDAEEAPGIVARVFGEAAVEVERWDAPLITLPDRDAVRDYLAARQVAEASVLARGVHAPVAVTKRGALVLARR